MNPSISSPGIGLRLDAVSATLAVPIHAGARRTSSVPSHPAWAASSDGKFFYGSLDRASFEAHRANIMRKLQLRTVSDLVRYAIRNKMVQP